MYCNSIGSLGKYKNEADVKDVTISDCTLFNTTNGLRIKTWADSPPSAASSITFKDIIMKSVKNPIIIDQKYGSKSSTKVIYDLILVKLISILLIH